ncbi:putative transposase [Agrobacterium larrymoorei]|uniref:Transposase n=1 Tax=Agrobacterium larrymoorei TaxID=160699 RepID=A0AAJ2ES58_9HYPH|nr:transposase domain-containing protein [Agrobacterium larrymoorei]MDR6102761.1 putative transposase [Agrobacterium larrymoorei]
MKQEWFSVAEMIAAKLPDMPKDASGYSRHITRYGWHNHSAKVQKQDGREGGGGFKYHYSLLPDGARSKLAYLYTELPDERNDASKLLWAKYEALTNEHKATCQKRLDAIVAVSDMKAAGIASVKAAEYCAQKAAVSVRTLYNWMECVEGHARQDWLAALAPSFSSAADGVEPELAECHPQAWVVLASDYLRLEAPAFSACYRRMTATAKKLGWAPIPSERTLRRHMDIKVPHAAQVLARKGKEEAKKLMPAQKRSVAHLAAMQITNTDGHKLDLHVKFPDRDKPGRVFLMAIQDIYSRKILSWVLTESETWDAVRTIIGNMVEVHGIPDHLYMDNGKAFASKKISGGAKSRHRYKITEDEVAGLLKTLGIKAHFVTPYSGQSKPIERGWSDLAENICKHPAMAGCYTGRNTQEKPENYGQRAVPLAELEEHVARCIEEHNARTGRETETAKGRSFDQVFAESIADPANLPRFASPSQRSLWMLTAETVTARKPSGAIHLFENRYFDNKLNQWIGKKLTVRFDPSNLHASVKIYDPKGRFICDAKCVEPSGFDCVADAAAIAKARKAKAKDDAAARESNRRLNDLQLTRIMKQGEQKPADEAAKQRPTVTRLITKSPVAIAPAVTADEISDAEFESKFSRAMAALSGADDTIIPFPTRE